MKVNITTKHVEVTNGIKEYAQEKFGKAERFLTSVQSIDVILKDEDRLHHCEAIIQIKNREPIVIDVAREELNEAIDVAVDKCERQLRRIKEKTQDKRRKSTVIRPGVSPE